VVGWCDRAALTAACNVSMGIKALNNHIKIRKLDGTWVVRSGAAVLGESRDALEMREGDYPPVIYFPRKDIAMALLERSNKTTFCPHKGIASYYTIDNRSSRAEDAVWSYETPLDDVARISEHLAFYTNDGVTVEQN
jgi:uncharacterized protein (DUF427 family)